MSPRAITLILQPNLAKYQLRFASFPQETRRMLQEIKADFFPGKPQKEILAAFSAFLGSLHRVHPDCKKTSCGTTTFSQLSSGQNDSAEWRVEVERWQLALKAASTAAP
jgi:hypothetical protein